MDLGFTTRLETRGNLSTRRGGWKQRTHDRAAISDEIQGGRGRYPYDIFMTCAQYKDETLNGEQRLGFAPVENGI